MIFVSNGVKGFFSFRKNMSEYCCTIFPTIKLNHVEITFLHARFKHEVRKSRKAFQYGQYMLLLL